MLLVFTGIGLLILGLVLKDSNPLIERFQSDPEMLHELGCRSRSDFFFKF